MSTDAVPQDVREKVARVLSRCEGGTEDAWLFWLREADAAIAALREAGWRAVRVLPLVWFESEMRGWNGDYHTVPTGYTVRCADENGWKWQGYGGHGYALSPDSAKMEAQADHERRVLAALSAAPEPPA